MIDKRLRGRVQVAEQQFEFIRLMLVLLIGSRWKGAERDKKNYIVCSLVWRKHMIGDQDWRNGPV